MRRQKTYSGYLRGLTPLIVGLYSQGLCAHRIGTALYDIGVRSPNQFIGIREREAMSNTFGSHIRRILKANGWRQA